MTDRSQPAQRGRTLAAPARSRGQTVSLRARTSRTWSYVLFALLVGPLVSSCGWATERSLLVRGLLWRDADMGDIDRFPARSIARGLAPPFSFHAVEGSGYDTVFRPIVVQRDEGQDTIGFEHFLESQSSWSFLMARRDTLLYERYFDGRSGDRVETTFSVSKSLVSLGVGLAIDRGFIGSVDDPITTYLPELADRDPGFEDVTLRHLLTMSSGIRFERGKMPWGDEARSYYHPDLRSVALSRDLSDAPGTEFRYNFYSPLLVGLAVERATGMTLSALLEAGVWTRIGTESAASWSLDSRRHGFEKMESGFNAAPRDLLRLGRLYLNRGSWNGEQILSPEWVDASVRADSIGDSPGRYGYYWHVNAVDGRGPSYFAEGRFGQFVYVVPDLDLIMVRTGHADDIGWRGFFEAMARRIEAVDKVASTSGTH